MSEAFLIINLRTRSLILMVFNFCVSAKKIEQIKMSLCHWLSFCIPANQWNCCSSPWQPVPPPALPMAPPSPSTNNSSSSSSTTGWEQLSKTNLYIRGLPPGTTDHDLVKLCQPWVFQAAVAVMFFWQSLHSRICIYQTFRQTDLECCQGIFFYQCVFPDLCIAGASKLDSNCIDVWQMKFYFCVFYL